MSNVPVVLELSEVPSIPVALRAFRNSQNLLVMESSRPHSRLGRYSFLCAAPVFVSRTESPEYGVDPFAEIRNLCTSYSAQTVPGLPPFQGGFAGLLGYELGRCWEKLPRAQYAGDQLPGCVIGMYSWVLSWDHHQNRCWIVSHGDPGSSPSQRQKQAERQCTAILHKLQEAKQIADDYDLSDVSAAFDDEEPSVHEIEANLELRSNFRREDYLVAVQQVIDKILAGDLFQANLSQRLTADSQRQPWETYLALRTHNPSPFAGFFQQDDWAVVSSSPERFIQKSGTTIWTRPIKGTRQRYPIPEADLFTRDELRESEKDRAENIMIVDLLRNDFSRVCKPGTVRVPEICSVETYETVTHLVSEVTGELCDGMDFWDVIRATFPGGSITGAPKIRAMELITEIEQVARGAYCGSLFYHGFDGTADSNILIRTMTQRGTRLSFPVGGGIVARSIPELEYEETLHKALGMIAALAKR